jgi:transcriptional regulator with XRE-family HTH domain
MHNFNKLIIAVNLSEARRERRITQKELAKTIGMSAETLSQYERGVKTPGVVALEKIARALNTTIDHLLQGITHKNFDCEKARELEAFLLNMDAESLSGLNEMLDKLLFCYYSAD